MAIVFGAAKKKQKLFFWIIIVSFILVLMIISLITFFPIFKDESSGATSEKSLEINFNIIDSDQVKGLEPFSMEQKEFVYTAKNKYGRQIQGTVSAASQEDAKSNLEKTGLSILNLKEATVGKDQPFIPYYQTVQKPVLK